MRCREQHPLVWEPCSGGRHRGFHGPFSMPRAASLSCSSGDALGLGRALDRGSWFLLGLRFGGRWTERGAVGEWGGGERERCGIPAHGLGLGSPSRSPGSQGCWAHRRRTERPPLCGTPAQTFVRTLPPTCAAGTGAGWEAGRAGLEGDGDTHPLFSMWPQPSGERLAGTTHTPVPCSAWDRVRA